MFKNREEAGFRLAQKLSSFNKKDGVLVLGIPRGGVVIAKIVAEELKLPLDVLVTRKIGAPNQLELAIGAVGPGETVVLDKDLINKLRVDENWLKEEIEKKKREVGGRIKKFGQGKKYGFKNKTIILTDDGVATGATVEAAIKYLRKVGIKKIILTVPVAPKDTLRHLSKLVEETLVLETPEFFEAVGQFYQDFPQVTDKEVIQLLQ